jgi:serine/threonine protein kinase
MPELSTGDVLAGYRVEALAGRGGMGVVYRATQLALERQVALKLIAPELAQDESFRERFKRESRTAALIEHAHVIPVHEAGEADGELFIAMRFIEGIDLRELIRREGRIEPARAVRLLAQVASALDAAHARGLVHRDIKPGNVIIAHEDGQDHAYLTDFGLSKNVSSDSIALTAAGEFVGTIDYTAPELVLGKPFDSRLDIYSLGCVMFEVLTGTPPFGGRPSMRVLFAHLQEPPPDISAQRADISAATARAITRALEKEPEDRSASAADYVSGVARAAGVGL